MNNLIKEKMLNGETVLGTFFNLGGSTAAECLGIAGLDFFIIDTEHGPFDVESSMDFIRAAELRGMTPLVRVKESSRSSIPNSMDEYFKTCNEKTMILLQCETQGCLNDIEEIVKLDGIDGIFIGPYDLSIGMGKAAQFTDPEFTKAITRIVKACKDAGKFVFIYSADSNTAKKHLADGFNGIAINMDVMVYINAFKSIIKEVRNI
ncbi:MAG: aldolase/citrate lyase family protein [Bacillota bacterium]|nr:aldolase/citrate lyase family protein [Bacillota bacterium]